MIGRMVRIPDSPAFERYRRWWAQRAEGRLAFKRSVEAKGMLRALVEARNEPDPDERHRLIEKCASPSVVMVDDGPVGVGLASLSERFARDHGDQEFVVEITAPVETRGDDVWTRWEVSGLHKEPVTQIVTARVDYDAGRLTRVDVTPAREPTTPSLVKRVAEGVAANPLAAVGAVGGATYFALRLPTQFFYARLGTTPDEVGLGPQVLVPQSLFLLLLFVIASALVYPLRTSRMVFAVRAVRRLWQDKRRFAAGITLVIQALVFGTVLYVGQERIDAVSTIESTASGPPADVPAPEWLGAFLLVVFLTAAFVLAPLAGQVVPAARLAAEELAAERRRRRDRWERRSAVLLLTASAVLGAFVTLTAFAILSGIAVRDGGDAGGELFPWRALPATVDFKPTAAALPLTNRCGELRLLGSANSQIVLFDTRQDRAFRVPVVDASVSTDVGCLWIAGSTTVRSVPDCHSGKCLWGVTLAIDVSDEMRTSRA